ncbi:hypothetical protein [Sphingomonas sp. PB4P5]|uniref:hypothetical protein n=1 Tax=Parasphingomonas puruogangriensis TaxID=3096155 RepID=UPI002FC9EE6C
MKRRTSFPIADVRSTMHRRSMQHSSIVAFLTGKLSPEALAEEIAAEVAAFRDALRLTAIGHIAVSDGPQFLITKDAARRLLEAVLDQRLPFTAANYVADCIIMNNDFDFADDAARDAIHYIEDDSGKIIAQDDHWQPPRDETLAAIALLD